MIEIKKEIDCCGCTACEQVCNRHAITMEKDRKGFLYPHVDQSKCNSCGLCKTVCPMLKDTIERKPDIVYAVKNRDNYIRTNSSSGGIAHIFAEHAIGSGGIVYGAVFNEQWQVVHDRIVSKEQLPRLWGSKYVQSDLKDSYRHVREDLKAGRQVTFFGTPCQVLGLKSFLKKNYATLTTIDFVCHGVPNPRIWGEYLKTVTAVRRSLGKIPFCSSLNLVPSIEDIKFRDKQVGWEKYRFVFQLAEVTADGKKNTVLSSYHRENTYMLLFLNDFILRPSCHHCPCRCGRSGADITMGDFWDIERFHPDFFDDNGVSLCFTYGRALPQHIADACDTITATYKEACWGNPCILRSHPRSPEANFFYWVHDILGVSLSRSLNVCLALKFCRTAVKESYWSLKHSLKSIIK